MMPETRSKLRKKFREFELMAEDEFDQQRLTKLEYRAIKNDCSKINSTLSNF